MTKIGMMIVGAWAGGQLLVVSGTGVTDHGRGPGHVHVTRAAEVVRQPSGTMLRSVRNEIINHAKERTWSLSWYSGDQLWQLMEMNARYCRDTLVQFLRHVASTNENQTRCSCDERVCGKFFDLFKGGDACLYESIYNRPSTKNRPARMAT